MDGFYLPNYPTMDDTMYDTLEEEPTLRKVVDCRDQPSVMDCSVKISADTDEEVLEAAVQHAISKH